MAVGGSAHTDEALQRLTSGLRGRPPSASACRSGWMRSMLFLIIFSFTAGSMFFSRKATRLAAATFSWRSVATWPLGSNAVH